MPILFGLLGIMLIIAGWNNTYAALGAQLSQDFTGGGAGFSHSFLPWLGAIVILWMISSIPGLEKPAKVFFGLLVLVFLISRQGVFAQFQAAFTSAGAQAPASTPIPLPQGPAPIQLTVGGAMGGSGGSGGIGSVIGSLLPGGQ
jgi:hypothetical protein